MTGALVTVAAVVLMAQDDQVLIARRPEGKAMAGLWEFPGGKLEVGETPEQALTRELHEELGIAVESQDLKPLTFASHAYEDFHLLMPLYVCRVWDGTIEVKEHEALEWAWIDDLRRYPMPAADVPLVDFLMMMKSQLKTGSF